MRSGLKTAFARQKSSWPSRKALSSPKHPCSFWRRTWGHLQNLHLHFSFFSFHFHFFFIFTETVLNLGPTEGSSQAAGDVSRTRLLFTASFSGRTHHLISERRKKTKQCQKKKKIRTNHVSAQLLFFFFCIFPPSLLICKKNIYYIIFSFS